MKKNVTAAVGDGQGESCGFRFDINELDLSSKTVPCVFYSVFSINAFCL